MKKFLVLSLVILALLGSGWWWQSATSPVCQKNCPAVLFTVSKGESLSQIAKRLEEEKLIRSSLVFQILVVKEGLKSKIQAGNFRLNSGMKPSEIAQKMTVGTVDRRVTLIEGWRREEIAQKLTLELQKEGSKFNEQEFLELTVNLEGKLFPDTYLIPQDADAQKVVNLLTNNFNKKTTNLALNSENLVLASIIEREAKKNEDRPIIAGILKKRVTNGWTVQADATVQYALGTANCYVGKVPKKNCRWWVKSLKEQDMKINSPYNTYLVKGFPPRPIGNPGLASIKAALNPVQTDFWYYLSDNEGKMYYAQTLREHQENIRLFLSQ